MFWFLLLLLSQYSYSQNLTMEQKIKVNALIKQMRDKARFPKEVLELSNQVMEIDQYNVRMKALRGKALNQLGKFQEALENLDYFIQKQPGSVIGLIYRSESYIGLNRTKEALEDLKNAELNSGNNQVFNAFIARLYVKLNEPEKAIEIYRKQIKNAPYNYRGYLGIASIRKQEKNYTEALEYYNKTLEALNRDIDYMQGGFAHIFRDKAEVCYELKKYEDAIEAINKVILLGNATAYDLRAKIYLAYGRKDAALYDLKQLSKYAPNYTPKTVIPDNKNITNYTPDIAWLKQVEAYNLFNQIKYYPDSDEELTESIKLLDKALQITPENLYFTGLRGAFLQKFGEEEKAILDFNTVLKKIPDCSEAYLFLSIAKKNIRNVKGALEDIDKAILLNPYDPFYFESRASYRLRMGDSLLAIYDLDKAIDLDKSSIYNFVLRGDLKLLLQKDLEGAMEDYQYIVTIGNETPHLTIIPAHHMVAKIYDLKGEYETAIELINEDISLEPETGFLYAFRGEVKARMKKIKEACEDWQTAKKYGAKNVDELLLYNCK